MTLKNISFFLWGAITTASWFVGVLYFAPITIIGMIGATLFLGIFFIDAYYEE